MLDGREGYYPWSSFNFRPSDWDTVVRNPERRSKGVAYFLNAFVGPVNNDFAPPPVVACHYPCPT